MGLSDQLPRALRRLRIARRMTQEELAAAAGIGRSAINSYEVGRHLPRLDTLDRLLAVLEVDIGQLTTTVSELEPAPEHPRRRYRAPGRAHPPPAPSAQSGAAQTDPESEPAPAAVSSEVRPETFLEVLGHGLGRLREHRKLTLAEVAAGAGMSESSLSRIERGQLQLKIEALGKILTALDADLLTLGLSVHLLTSSSGSRTLARANSERHLLALAIAAIGLGDVVRQLEE